MKEIGKRLGISPRTVETHITNIKRQLGLTSHGEILELLHGQKSIII